MKRMLWLATTVRQAVFDELFDECGIVAHYYNTQDIPSLCTFAAREKTIMEQDYFVADLSGSDYADDDIIAAVRVLKRLSSARLIFLAPRCQATEALFAALAQERVWNTIYAQQADEVQQLRVCLTGDGRGMLDQPVLQQGMASRAMQLMQPLVIPENKILTISVAGTLPRIGTTTQTLAIALYLRAMRQTPLIADRSGRLYHSMAAVYRGQCEMQDGYLKMDGLSVHEGLSPPAELLKQNKFNVCVSDFGQLTEDTVQAFLSGDIHVLITGVKPWELPSLAAASSMLEGAPYHTLASFATEEALDAIREYLNGNAEIAPYRPNPFAQTHDNSAYQRLLMPVLKEACAA